VNAADYVFKDAGAQDELKRLRALEAIFDPATRRRFLAAGVTPGARCLEAGAGAGSVLRWLAETAGPSGEVTAVDMDTRFLHDPPPNARVLAGDLRALALPPASFDIVHSRYVLVHIPEHEAVLDSLWRALKPGGRLVVEEPDFTAFRALAGEEDERRSFDNIHRAILRMYAAKGVEPALGAKLPGLLQARGATDLAVENDSPVSQGGTALPEMMRLSSAPLREKYIATGAATAADLDGYGAFTRSPRSWAVYYATIAVTARK